MVGEWLEIPGCFTAINGREVLFSLCTLLGVFFLHVLQIVVFTIRCF